MELLYLYIKRYDDVDIKSLEIGIPISKLIFLQIIILNIKMDA